MPFGMSIAVVIVSYNVCAALRSCLQSLQRAGPWAEVVVVDNASSDGSAAMVAAWPAAATDLPLRLLQLQENCGFGLAVNRAVAAVTAPFVLLLNPDTELPAGAAGRMAQLWAATPTAGAMGFRQVDGQGFWQLAVGPPPTFGSEWLRRALQRRLDARHRRIAWGLDRWLRRPRPVGWVAASALLVPRQLFLQLDGFDARFFLYFEDIDFCLRLRQLGRQVIYEPRLTLVHHRGASAAHSPQLAGRAYRRSQLYFWDKHHGRLQGRLLRAYLALQHGLPAARS